jgi:hypothetical protein
MDTEEVEAMVEDIEKDPLATDMPPHVLFANDCLCAKGTCTKNEEDWWRIWRRIHQPRIFLRTYLLVQ